MARKAPKIPTTLPLGAASAALKYAVPLVFTNTTRPIVGRLIPGQPCFILDEGANGTPVWVNQDSTGFVDATGTLT